MNFALPIAAFLALLAPVVIYLYMRRPKRREIPIPSILFWSTQAASHSPKRQAVGRIQSWKSLVLMLAALILLIVALMQPQLANFLTSQNTVIILDTRLRMQAQSGDGESALDRAKLIAESLLGQAGPNHEIAVLRAGAGIQTLSPFSNDARKLRELVRQQTPDDGSSDLKSAIRLAKELLAETPEPSHRRIVCITDRAMDEVDPEVEQILVGTSASNLAITELGTRAAPGLTNAQEVTVRAKNFGSSVSNIEIDLRNPTTLLDTVSLEIAPGESAGRTLSIPAPNPAEGQAELTAIIRQPDPLKEDNIRRALIQVSEPTRVLLVTEGNWFLERAIAADASVQFELLDPKFWKNSMAPAFDVVIFDDFIPDGLFPDALSTSRIIFFGKSPWDATERHQGDFVVTEFQIDSPLLSGVDLTDTRIAELNDIESDAQLRTIVASGDKPLVSAISDSLGSPLGYAFHFPISATDLPLRAAFPILLANAIHQLAPQPDQTPKRVGQSLVNDHSGQPEVAAYDQAGFYHTPLEKQAINPATIEESDLRANTTTPGAIQVGLTVPSLWQFLAFFAALALIVEATLRPVRP